MFAISKSFGVHLRVHSSLWVMISNPHFRGLNVCQHCIHNQYTNHKTGVCYNNFCNYGTEIIRKQMKARCAQNRQHYLLYIYITPDEYCANKFLRAFCILAAGNYFQLLNVCESYGTGFRERVLFTHAEFFAFSDGYFGFIPWYTIHTRADLAWWPGATEITTSGPLRMASK